MPEIERAGRLGRFRVQDWPVAGDWQPLVDGFFQSAQGKALAVSLEERLAQGAVVYPDNPLRMLQLTPLADVKVVVLGQDPYHGPGQAEGLAFSVRPGIRIPPSLRNIHKEVARDLGHIGPMHGSLSGWADQGVLLLNTCLTVEDGLPGVHARLGWAGLTSQVLSACNGQSRGVVFMLWGAHAQAFRSQIDDCRHLVLTANHPSPLSALRPPQPFIGCGHFGQANRWLLANGQKEINWFAPGQKTMA